VVVPVVSVVVPVHAQLDGESASCSLVTALCAGASLAHAQQLPSIVSLSESYVVYARWNNATMAKISPATKENVFLLHS
jgi:hypothetical protein